MTPWQLRQSVLLLRAGGVVAHPTEAVWGLACNPLDEQAVLRVLALKQRPVAKGLILVASEFDQLEPFVEPVYGSKRARIETSWPGPITWLMTARPGCPSWVRGVHTTVAVRVTAHALTRALCDAFGGPLVSTSANPATRPPARTAQRVRQYFGQTVDYLLAGATDARARPSEIRDAETGAVIRNG